MKTSTKGTLYTLIAGIAWGISGVSGQYLIENGMPVDLITMLRLLVSGVVLTAIAVVRQPQQLKDMLGERKSLGLLAVFALTGLALNQLAYLTAIQHSNAGTATVLQYLCPIIVLAYTCLRQAQWPTRIELISMFLAIFGTFLMATHGQIRELAITPLGLFWGIFSAVTYAIYIILPLPLIKRFGSLVVMGVGMLMGGIVLSLYYQIWTYSIDWTSGTILGLFGIVGIGTIFAYTVFLEGVSMVGSVKGSLLASIEPVASVIFAVLLINEVFHVIDLLGMVLILGAVLLISLRDLLALNKQKQNNNPV
ncbi:DMT family transporter [Streptococcus cameli]